MKVIRTYLPAILAVSCWSLSFVWIKDAYADFTPLSLVMVRLLGASVLLIIIGLISKKLQRIKRGDLLLFITLAFFEPFLYFLGESFGMTMVSSTLGAVIVSTIPLFTPLLSYVLLKEKVSVSNVIGIILSLLGVLIIVVKFDGGLSAPLAGILLMFLAVFAAIFYPIFLKKLAHHYTGVSIVAYQSIFGIFFFLPLFVYFDYKTFIATSFSSDSIIAAIELTIFASTLAFLFFTESVRRIGVMRSNVFANLIPVLTAMLAFFFRGEDLSSQKIAGISIVIIGLFVSQMKFKRRHETKS